jgi:hypothetical protein
MSQQPFTYIADYKGIGSGWKVPGHPGVVDSYGSALALNMGLWDEMVEWYRVKGKHKTTKELFSKS